MELIFHEGQQQKVAELQASEEVVLSAGDGLDLLGTAYYEGAFAMIWPAHAITPAFFDLQTGLAGEVLQKFSNYRMRLVLTGDFSGYESKALRDFIYESNQGKLINFLPDTERALKELGI